MGAVNLGSAWIFMYRCGIEPVRANFLAWILYNFVSFITNRKSVFHTVAEDCVGVHKRTGVILREQGVHTGGGGGPDLYTG